MSNSGELRKLSLTNKDLLDEVNKDKEPPLEWMIKIIMPGSGEITARCHR